MSEISNLLPPSITEMPSVSDKPKQAMGKDDFMKLLMTQLQNQDPLKPMDHEQFSAQLAQFSSLEQLANIGKGIDGLHQGLGEGAKLQAVNMIGKSVSALGNEIELVKGETVTIHNSLPEGVKPSSVTIYSPLGQVAREMQVNAKSGGEIVWDGKDDLGVSLPSGQYRFRIHGVGDNGVAQDGDAEVKGLVTGVDFSGRTPVLLVKTASGQSKIDMEKVSKIQSDSQLPSTVKSKESLPSIPGSVSKNIGATAIDGQESEDSEPDAISLSDYRGIEEKDDEQSENRIRGNPYDELIGKRLDPRFGGARS